MQEGFVRIEINDGEVESILTELHEAQETIRKCYSKLIDIGVVVIKSNAVSGN